MHRSLRRLITALMVVCLGVLGNLFISASTTSRLKALSHASSTKRKPKPKPKSKKHVNHCSDPEPSSAQANNCNLHIDEPFKVGCELPFDGGKSREIDEHCPNGGCTNSVADVLQNKIKNNYCVTGAAVEINFESIDRLQSAVDKMKLNYGPKKKSKTGRFTGGPPLPKERSKIGRGKLATVDKQGNPVMLGEGDLVSIVGIVLDAHHADTFPFGFAGETVNCKNSLLEWNDIHIALVETPNMKECDSVTAEIIPHFRPSLWERFDSNSCTVGHVTNPLPVEGIQVKLTGQLFFDGSHRALPCSSPKRRSVWEVHPVYRIEVFDVAISSFVPFNTWAAQQH
jgi:hypothetical protein